MTEYCPRFFESDAAVRHIGEGLLACSLTRPEWTHEAHLAACLWLVRERPDICTENALPDIIRRFNEAVGGVNDDHNGYHETITQAFIIGVRLHLAERPGNEPLHASVNALFASPMGKRDWPFRFYSRERLFSVAARRGYLTPDIKAFPPIPN